MTAPQSLKTLMGAACLEARERLHPYETPERGEPGHTDCVLLPADEPQVAAVLATSNAEGLPLVVSAGRTGLVEAQRPLGESVLSLERLNRPLRFRLADGREHVFAATGDLGSWSQALASWWLELGRPAVGGAQIEVQAALAVDALNDIVQPLGLMFPMEMGSSAAATVGACAANASAGANAVCYGTGAHMVDAAWGYWGDGRPAGPCAIDPWQAPSPERLAIDSARLHRHWGLLGTQGTLGVITRLRLRLVPVPAQREAALIPVSGMPVAMEILSAARAQFPSAIEEFEFMSRRSVEWVRALRGDAFRLPFPAIPAEDYLLLLQVKSEDPEGDLAARLYGFLSEGLALPDEQIGYAPLSALKAVRHSITEASNLRMRQLQGGRLAFDTATPAAVFGDYLADLERALLAYDPALEFIAFGHAGVGGAHLHILGSRERPVAMQAQALVNLVIDETLKYGGTFSAEHGIGPKWADAFLQRTPGAELAELARLKRDHDPRNVLNPRSFGLDRLLQGRASSA